MTESLGDPLIRPRAMRRLLNVSDTTLWRMRRRGEFPEPIRVTSHLVGWRASTYEAWLNARDQERQAREQARDARAA